MLPGVPGVFVMDVFDVSASGSRSLMRLILRCLALVVMALLNLALLAEYPPGLTVVPPAPWAGGDGMEMPGEDMTALLVLMVLTDMVVIAVAAKLVALARLARSLTMDESATELSAPTSSSDS